MVTPLTTLVVTLAQSTGQSIADAQNNVKSALGLPDVDLTTFDAVAATASGTDPNAATVLAAAVQVQTTITQLAAATGSNASVTTALATALSTRAAVDLTSQAVVTSQRDVGLSLGMTVLIIAERCAALISDARGRGTRSRRQFALPA